VIFDTLRSEYFKLVEEYRVGEVVISGHVRSWGYEAFFASRCPVERTPGCTDVSGNSRIQRTKSSLSLIAPTGALIFVNSEKSCA
jgi:hypothetical protein